MKRFLTRNPLRQSFTLIELVVAMAVFSLMMLMMMQFFTGTQELWSKTDEKNNMYADARIAMDLISSALQSVYYEESSAADFKGFFFRAKSCEESAAPRITFPVKLSRESPFYYTDKLKNEDAGFVKAFYLSFFLENDTNAAGNTVALLKVANDGGSTPNAFTADATAAPAAPNTDKQTVIGNIVSLKFRLFRGTFTTLNVSGSEYTGREFPRAVEVKLKMMPKNAYDTWAAMTAGGPKDTFQAENEFEFVRVVYLGAY